MLTTHRELMVGYVQEGCVYTLEELVSPGVSFLISKCLKIGNLSCTSIEATLMISDVKI